MGCHSTKIHESKKIELKTLSERNNYPNLSRLENSNNKNSCIKYIIFR